MIKPDQNQNAQTSFFLLVLGCLESLHRHARHSEVFMSFSRILYCQKHNYLYTKIQKMDVNASYDEKENMDLHKACRLGDIEYIKRSLEAKQEQINDKDTSLGWTPIYRTVICGHVRATRYLLKHGADPNNSNNLGETPLH
jgi:ankyrin repeat protein